MDQVHNPDCLHDRVYAAMSVTYGELDLTFLAYIVHVYSMTDSIHFRFYELLVHRIQLFSQKFITSTYVLKPHRLWNLLANVPYIKCKLVVVYLYKL